MRDAYLEPWTGIASAARLRAALGLVRRIGPADRALTWYRVASLVDASARGEIAAGLLEWLREILVGLDGVAPHRDLP